MWIIRIGMGITVVGIIGGGGEEGDLLFCGGMLEVKAKCDGTGVYSVRFGVG